MIFFRRYDARSVHALLRLQANGNKGIRKRKSAHNAQHSLLFNTRNSHHAKMHVRRREESVKAAKRKCAVIDDIFRCRKTERK